MFVLLPAPARTGKGIIRKDLVVFTPSLFQERLRTFFVLILNLHTLYQEHRQATHLEFNFEINRGGKKILLASNEGEMDERTVENHPHALVDGWSTATTNPLVIENKLNACRSWYVHQCFASEIVSRDLL